MFTKIFATSLLLLLTSCNSTKEATNENKSEATINEQSNITMEKQLVNEGFHIGEIMHLKNSDCEYIIIDQATKAKYDPINISEETYKAYRNDGEKIYYKYRPLRRMNRCTDANPVELIDIKKREG